MYLKASIPLTTIFHFSYLFSILYNIFKADKWTWKPFWILAATLGIYFILIYLDLRKKNPGSMSARPNPYQTAGKQEKRQPVQLAQSTVQVQHPVSFLF